METPKTEEKVVTAKSEGDKTETPKKKKNIIRVFHAQNASDGGKTRRKPCKAEGERTGHAKNCRQKKFAGANTEMVSPVTDQRRNSRMTRRGTAGNSRKTGRDRTVREEPQGRGKKRGGGSFWPGKKPEWRWNRQGRLGRGKIPGR